MKQFNGSLRIPYLPVIQNLKLKVSACFLVSFAVVLCIPSLSVYILICTHNPLIKADFTITVTDMQHGQDR